MSRTFVTLGLALVLLILAACAPATAPDANAATTATSDAAQTAALIAPEGFDTWQLDVHGVTVNFTLVDVVLDPDGNPAPNLSGGSDVDDGVCNVVLRRSDFDANNRREVQIQSIASMVGTCVYALELDYDVEGFNFSFEYGFAWSRVYNERCGLLAQPLGWPADDGACELPAATEPRPAA